MINRRIVWILVSVMLIGFGVGFYSLIYIDEFRLSNLPNLNLGNIDISSNGSNVKVGLDGIEVIDGDDQVIVNWDGINVTDGDNKVVVGPGGIDVEDSGSSNSGNWNKNSWSIGNWFGFTNKDLNDVNIDEEKIETIDGIDSIKINSSFIDVKVTTEYRDDVRIKYFGRMKSNVTPKLESTISGNELEIKLVTENINSYTVTQSDVMLEVFVPRSYEGDFTINGSSADIIIDNIIAKDIDISTSSGDLILNKIQSNNLQLNTSSGNIVSKDAYGDVNANTSSGDVSFTINGSTGDYTVNTSSGDVDFKYGYDSSYIGTIKTSSGDLEYEGRVHVTKNSKNNYEFTIGSGNKKTINVSTSSGDIEFESIE